MTTLVDDLPSELQSVEGPDVFVSGHLRDI
jgi:hypothetical protein